MNTNEIVKNICKMPADFYAGTKSMLQLISDSGVTEYPSILAVDTLAPYLTEHPELISAWMQWSGNKRVSSGWYFSKQDSDYVVGFHPNGEVFKFDSAERACAEFIVRELHAMVAIKE